MSGYVYSHKLRILSHSLNSNGETLVKAINYNRLGLGGRGWYKHLLGANKACDELVSRPGGVKDSHPLNSRETGDKRWLHGPIGS